MLVLLKAGWMITVCMGMTRAPTPDLSTDPRLTAHLVGLGSLWRRVVNKNCYRNVAQEAQCSQMDVFQVTNGTCLHSELQSVTTCCEWAWRRRRGVSGTGDCRSRATPPCELLLHLRSCDNPAQDAHHSLKQKPPQKLRSTSVISSVHRGSC